MNPIAVPLSGSATTGATPTPPATLQSLISAAVAAVVPGYTSDLPGSLIEDVLSTGVGFMVSIDQARVDAVNSISTTNVGAWLLAQLGQQLGIPQGQANNTSVYVVFSGPSGYLIPNGFIVSDGTYQYVTQNGVVIGSSGTSAPTYCVASLAGSWAVLANTVTQIVTSVPSGYTITVNNPSAGIAGTSAQSVQSYRAQLLAAQTVTAQGFAQFVTTLLQAIPGVNPRLVSVQQVSNGWKIICGGGDTYEVAGAIYLGVLDLSTLRGSSVTSNNISVQIVSPPNNVSVVYVNPPDQIVTMTVTWATNILNFASGPQVDQLAQVALTSYINSLTVGSPINLLEANAVFQNAVASVLSAVNISALTYVVTINGVTVAPETGTQLIPGDSESYFSATATAVTVTQG